MIRYVLAIFLGLYIHLMTGCATTPPETDEQFAARLMAEADANPRYAFQVREERRKKLKRYERELDRAIFRLKYRTTRYRSRK